MKKFGSTYDFCHIRNKEILVFALYTIIGMFVGFEGYDDGHVYLGVYTPQCEYGYVMTMDGIYLDTIFTSQD